MTPYYDDGHCVIYHADCRDVLPLQVLLDAKLVSVRRDSQKRWYRADPAALRRLFQDAWAEMNDGESCDCPCHAVIQPGLIPCPQCAREVCTEPELSSRYERPDG